MKQDPRFPNLFILDHPLIQHKLTHMRDKTTCTRTFRQLLREITLLMGYEVTRNLPLTARRIETPLATMQAPVIAGKKLAIVPVLRAGIGMADGLLELIPSARVGHIGLYRDPETLEPVEYYFKVPEDIRERQVIVVDPMLATGNSATAALNRLKEVGVTSLKLVNLLASPEGLRAVQGAHPDVPITVAAVDERLDEHGYIVPGLGDAGDRMFGTK